MFLGPKPAIPPRNHNSLDVVLFAMKYSKVKRILKPSTNHYKIFRKEIPFISEATVAMIILTKDQTNSKQSNTTN